MVWFQGRLSLLKYLSGPEKGKLHVEKYLMVWIVVTPKVCTFSPGSLKPKGFVLHMINSVLLLLFFRRVLFFQVFFYGNRY